MLRQVVERFMEVAPDSEPGHLSPLSVIARCWCGRITASTLPVNHMGVCRKVGMAQANPTLPPPPLVLTRQALLPEHCFAPAPHIFVILNTTSPYPHKFFKKFQVTSCLTLYNTYNAVVPQENRVSAGRYQCIECNAPQTLLYVSLDQQPTRMGIARKPTTQVP